MEREQERISSWKGVAEVLRPRNLVQPGLLVLLEKAPGHGYDLQHRLESLLEWRWDSPTIYRALNAMEEEGLVISAWERSDAGKERRRYEITEAGRGATEAWMRELANASALLLGLVHRHRHGEEVPDEATELAELCT